MKNLTKKKFMQKIVIVLLMVICFNFAVPIRAQAAAFDIGGDLLKELVQLLAAVGDIFTRCFKSFYAGDK